MASIFARSRLLASLPSTSRGYRGTVRTSSTEAHRPITSRALHTTSQSQSQAGLAMKEDYSNSAMHYNVPIKPNHHQLFDNRPIELYRNPTKRFFEDPVVESDQSETKIAEPLPVATNMSYHVGRERKFDKIPYWQDISRWKDVSEQQWLDYSWGTAKNIQGKQKLYQFLTEVIPERLPYNEAFEHIRTRDDFIRDVMEGIAAAPMSIRLTPHILSCINWKNPFEDPLRRQFIPMKSSLQPDHPMLTMDSLHETQDSPVEGLVHRYDDKCLFLAVSVCPLYCRYCTRSYAVGADTETVTKASLKPKKARWQDMFDYIERTPEIQDVVISGGDSYLLSPAQLHLIGTTLLKFPHVRRIRFASKGLCVSPSRTLDPHDEWTTSFISVVKFGRSLGKHVALHTHFNHANEFTWVSREAAQRFVEEGVTVRNQSVLLKGVNDTVESMGALVRELADCGIIPYYIYQHDLVTGLEDLRTPLSTILHLESSLRGSIAGFMTPQFVVDLPGGGGKRLAASFESYDREVGKSTFTAPAVKGGNTVYEYWDPVASLSDEGKQRVLAL